MASAVTAALAGAGRTLARTAAGLTLDLASSAAHLGDLAADTATGRPRSAAVLRVQVVILSDERGTPLCTADAVQPALDAAGEILSAAGGVRVRVVGVRTVTAPAPGRALDPRANRGLLLDDVVGHTAFYRRHLVPDDPAVRPGMVGAPVTVVVVRSIEGHTTGCSLGISADWVITRASLFDADDPHTYDVTVLAHELGHALNLPHHRDRANLMFPESSPPDRIRGTALTGWQRALIRTNRHVVPGRSGPGQD